MDAVSSVFPDPHARFVRRFGLLLRQDLRNWRIPALFTILFCAVLVEAAGALRMEGGGAPGGPSLHWSIGLSSSDAGVLLPAAARFGAWGVLFGVCLFFFMSGSFSDLARPQARQRWLLLPAPLWEKVLSRWLCGMVLFPALALAVSAGWFLLRNTDPDARTAAVSFLTNREALWKTVKFFAFCHALLFLLGALLKTKTRTLPAFFLVLFLAGLFLPHAWLESLRWSMFLFWPLAWAILLRSRA